MMWVVSSLACLSHVTLIPRTCTCSPGHPTSVASRTVCMGQRRRSPDSCPLRLCRCGHWVHLGHTVRQPPCQARLEAWRRRKPSVPHISPANSCRPLPRRRLLGCLTFTPPY